MLAVRPDRPETAAPSERVLDEYTTAWELGTGLPVSLPPGRYAVTRAESRAAERFLLLDDAFWLRTTE